MKPKDLKCPFKWDTRQPLIHDGVVFVPTHYDKHHEWVFPDFSDKQLFGNDQPVFIEYCSGNGDWVTDRALRFSECNWIAVEKRFDRVRKIWSKLKNQKLSNLLVICGDAMTFSQFYLPAQSVQEIFVNFPDPWPKRSHAKHRLIQPFFIEECARVVRKGGKATLVTDDKDYSHQMIHTMGASQHWQSCLAEPYYSTEWPQYGSSFFEALWRSKGCEIFYHQFERVISL
ncbi:MAG: tRNA (guanine(46)-N(7))-methyltransferase TrmB [Nitrosarchaeum sp.]|nr:tRNA (guanine(46)-N(7))-methyltransferase TrmB [Nitrosarchaeum sp.]